MSTTAVVTYDKPDLPVAGAATRNAQVFVVDDQTTYDMATDHGRELKRRRDAIEASRVSIVDPINAAKTAVQNLFNPVLADYDAAIGVIKGKMLTYARAEEMKRAEAQAEADRLRREATEAAEREAKTLEKAGHTVEAAVVREIEAVTPPAYVAPTLVQTGGTSIRKKWKFRIVSQEKMIAYIAAHPEYLNCIEFKQSALDRLAATFEGQLVFDGGEAYRDDGVSLRK